MFRETSVVAFRNLVENKKLSPLRRSVYKFLYEHGPLTQKKMRIAMGGDITSSIGPRFKELEDRGLIKEVGTEKCDDTGNMNTLYDVTGRTEELPVTKKKPKRAKIKMALDMVRELHMDLKGHPSRGKVKALGIYINEEL